MKHPIFTGTSTAIVTPFNDGGVNFTVLGQLIDRQIESGVSAITVCGTTGESSTMTRDERSETIRYAVKRAAGRVRIIAGTGSNDTEKALTLSLDAQNAGADALLLVTPYYNKTTQTGLIEHYIYIADRVSIPIILYNVPSRTGMTIQPDTCAALSRHPRINGIKEASGDIANVQRIIALCGDELNVWSGCDELTAAMMAVGAKGVISVLSNVIPREMSNLTAACLHGDFKTAAELQLKYVHLIDLLFSEVNPIPVKAAMKLLGYDAGKPRRPLAEMTKQGREKLRTELTRLSIEN